jgi:hypothetical protein
MKCVFEKFMMAWLQVAAPLSTASLPIPLTSWTGREFHEFFVAINLIDW